jgi:hypothetical protein
MHPHQFSKWTCPSCNTELLVNLDGVRKHLDTCEVKLSKIASNSINAAIDQSFADDHEDTKRKKEKEEAHLQQQQKKKSRRIGTSVKGSKT